jgi:uncharacterized protein (TIGR00730 family)
VTKTVCIFCGSSDGARDAYRVDALRLGQYLGERGFGLVYGGASVGLMGRAADAALAAGAPVVGVLPAVLRSSEVAHPGLTELHYVDTMHARKALMAERADAFVALPGGYGTLDELMEILTWAQLGIHKKPCVLVNTLGFFDGLLTFLDHAVQEGFLRVGNRELVRVVANADEAVALIAHLLAAA